MGGNGRGVCEGGVMMKQVGLALDCVERFEQLSSGWFLLRCQEFGLTTLQVKMYHGVRRKHLGQ